MHVHNEHNTYSRRDSCIPRRTTIYVDRYMRSRTVQTTLQGQPHNPCTAQTIPFRSMSPLKSRRHKHASYNSRRYCKNTNFLKINNFLSQIDQNIAKSFISISIRTRETLNSFDSVTKRYITNMDIIETSKLISLTLNKFYFNRSIFALRYVKRKKDTWKCARISNCASSMKRGPDLHGDSTRGTVARNIFIK